MSKTITVELSKVHADPQNPRQEFDPLELAKLEASIKRNGILSPLSVEEDGKGTYLLVDGERRFRASTNLKLKDIPVNVMPKMSDLERLVTRFHLQEQHSNWNAFEKANAIKYFLQEMKMSTFEIASTLGLQGGDVERLILVSALSKRTATAIANRKLPFEWIVELGRISKSVHDEGQRGDVENALLEKIDKKIVLRARELRKYRVALKTENRT